MQLEEQFKIRDNEYYDSMPNYIDVNNKINIFAGRNDSVVLSNFAKTQFIFKNITYHSVEQAYQHYKALYANDKRTARRILFSNEPVECKRIAKDIKNLHIDAWSARSFDVMHTLIRSCLSQNKKKRRALMNTGNALLTHIPDKSNWRYDFPKILMQCRELIKNNLL